MIALLCTLSFGWLVSAHAVEFGVAIYGGGVAGAALAQGLKGLDHIDVQYYDPGLDLTPPSFRYLGFGPNAWTALDLIGPEASGAIDHAGGKAEPSTIVVAGDGDDAGKVILDYAKLPNTTYRPDVVAVDPALFLKEMLSGTAPSRLHTNKTLIAIETHQMSDSLTLRFQDGTTAKTNVLIGDDGVDGFLKPYILGPKNPALCPAFANFLSTFAVVSSREGQKQLGSRYGNPEDPHRYEQIGNGSWWLSAIVGDDLRCVATFYTTEDYDVSQPWRPTTSAEIANHFRNFQVGDGIAKILSNQTFLALFPETEYPNASTFIRGPIAMTGSTAHPMTNFQEFGPGQDLEDAMILSALLQATSRATDLPTALAVYDAIRRPRTQQVAAHAKHLGLLWTGQVPSVGTDLEKLREALLAGRDVVAGFDLVKHREEALRMLAREMEIRHGGVGRVLDPEHARQVTFGEIS